MVDLFCGGGLGAVGMEAAGFDIIAAYDNDKRAVEAYRYNFGDHVRLADINELDAEDIPDADVFFGGPPCQDFSVAGTGAGDKGERGKLVWSYLRIIEAKKPKSFIFENVKGLITKRHRPTFDVLVEKFEDIGYNVSWKLINAWDYGVAQKRERVFIVGIRKDLGFTYEFPEPEPEDYRTKVLRDVIGDLYGLFYPPNHAGAVKTKEYGKREKGVGRHPISTEDEPAYTIVASATGGKNAFYPNHDSGSFWTPKSEAPRRFTVRECLRIQSVPDWYVLPDTLSLSAQYRIVGNGIPSRVAWYLGRALATQLKGASNCLALCRA